MIISKKKPLEEILGAMRGEKKLAIIGCSSCASACAVGGENECAAMKQALEERGFEIIVPALPAESCVFPYVRKAVCEATRAGAQAILSLACGSGVQTIAQNTDLPVYAGSNTQFIGQVVKAGVFNEMCRSCGDCLLNHTGGICPITKCAKSLVNGPCGGARNGKCEVNPENDCAWILIYNRLNALGQLDRLDEAVADKDYSRHCQPGHRDLKEDM